MRLKRLLMAIFAGKIYRSSHRVVSEPEELT
jgi:hypothetical protein